MVKTTLRAEAPSAAAARRFVRDVLTNRDLERLAEPDFVAVTLRRASEWARLRGLVLAAVADVFEVPAPTVEARWVQDPETSGGRRRSAASSSRATRLAHVWAELGPLRPEDARDLETVIRASHGEDPFRRQLRRAALLDGGRKRWLPRPAERRDPREIAG